MHEFGNMKSILIHQSLGGVMDVGIPTTIKCQKLNLYRLTTYKVENLRVLFDLFIKKKGW